MYRFKKRKKFYIIQQSINVFGFTFWVRFTEDYHYAHSNMHEYKTVEEATEIVKQLNE